MRHVPALLLIALAVSLPGHVEGQESPQRGPVALTAEQDHKRLMELLKISGFPPGAVATSPDTYNEAFANPYPNLPDPLTFKNGQKVTSAASWRKRRSEILEDFEREVYGRRPQRIPAVIWEVVKTTAASDGGVPTVAKQLLGRVDNSAYPAIAVNVQAILTLPASARGCPLLMRPIMPACSPAPHSP